MQKLQKRTHDFLHLSSPPTLPPPKQKKNKTHHNLVLFQCLLYLDNIFIYLVTQVRHQGVTRDIPLLLAPHLIYHRVLQIHLLPSFLTITTLGQWTLSLTDILAIACS